ncbi:MAG: DNA polymerase I, partial [Planctomycetes bacterium]|nr:DNA polymerase I [Planctomycetota bacterium]
MRKTFYIIDGHAQIYRAFYARVPPMNSPSGEPTAATHVFCAMLFNLIRDRSPDYLAMVLDPSPEEEVQNFRYAIAEAYKANRDPAPDELHVQADRIVEIVKALGIPVYCEAGFEADDLMATIATVCGEKHDADMEVYLVSRDKDLEQLISDSVRLLDPMKDEVLDAAALKEKKGYTPQQAIEIQTLAGDSTDNIAGVPGIGTKTAAKLIDKFGSAQAVLDNADKLTPKQSQNVKAFADQMPLTRRLVTLRRDVPFEFDLADCVLDKLNVSATRPIFDELGFRRLAEVLEGFGQDATGEAATRVTAVENSAGTAEGDLGRNQKEYELVDTSEALDRLVADLRSTPRGLFAFDTETTGINPVAAELVGLSFAWEAGNACYVPVRAAMGKVLPVDEIVKKLGPVFADASIGKVGQNIKYDLLVLRQVGIETEGVAFDTMIASFLLDSSRSSHSLDALVRGLFGHQMIPISDLIGKGKNQITMDQIDTARVGHYAAEDADYTWRLFEVFEPQIAGSHVEALFRETEMPLVKVLAEMEHNGIALDCALLERLGVGMSKRLEELAEEVHGAAGRPFNIDSPKQLAEVLFDEQGLTVIRKTKTGRSTDADTLTALTEKSDNPIPKLVLEYRELAKLKGTYVDTLPKMVCKRTGRVHASFHQTGAVTGRLSSSDPNLQNIPIRTETGRQIRAAVVAGDPNSVLLIADYSQIELRLLAHFCRDEALVEAFQTGQDIHRVVAAQVNAVAVEDVTAAQRSAAKAVNFGIIYGQSAFGLARSLGIP